MTMQRPAGFPRRFDGASVRSHVEESRAQYRSLEQQWDALVLAHENEWVAAYKGQFIFGKTIRDVIGAARKTGWPVDVIAVDHLTRRRPAVLL